MKKMLRNLTVAALAMTMAVSSVSAQGHGRHPGAGPTGRPAAPAHQRPQPGRPSHNPGYNRPGGPGHAPAPGPQRPPQGYHPGHSYGHVPPPPTPWHRPTPPPSWRPRPMGPSFGTVLGLAFGTAMANSINYLIGNNYNVVGYDNSAIVLSNVMAMNYMWPQARLMYNNGLLYGSQYYYPTSYYDLSRYNSVYSYLTRSFGPPVSAGPVSGGMQATWFSTNGFVTLTFAPAAGGYYTTLSLGN